MANIIEVLKDQREELETSLQEIPLVPREAEKNIDTASSLIQVVSGVRRCGKSVLIHQVLMGRHFGYVNFDDDRLLDAEPNAVLSGLYQVYGEELKTIFLDEIQNLDHWELFVNRLHRAGFKLFLTGSNAKLLAKEMATHLTGRHLTTELFPFSFGEFLKAKKFDADIETTKGKSIAIQHFYEYVETGGFPEVATEREKQQPYLRELYKKIVERDIVGRHNIKYKRTFREIANSITSNPARLFSYGKIRRQFSLGSDHTIKNYLGYLEEAYLVITINRFSFKPVDVEKSEKKLYSIDQGIIKTLSTQREKDTGHIYENIVAVELFRKKALQQDIELYYWKNLEQEEVDFVIRQKGKITRLIQVCADISDEKTKEREVRALLKASKNLKCKNLLLLTEETEREENSEWFGIKEKIQIIPIWKWLLGGQKHVKEEDRNT